MAPIDARSPRSRQRATRSCRLLKDIALVVLLAGGMGLPEDAVAETVLTVDDACRRALEFNPGYLAAREEVSKAQSEITKARAGALPELSAGGSYSRGFILSSFFVLMNDETVEIRTGFKNSFGAYLSLRQSLWQGGKVMTALAIAKLYTRYSQAEVQAAQASVIENAEVLFYSAILEKSRLAAFQKEMEATSQNLEVIEKKYSQGMVSNFEVLRARVEKLNLEPALLKTESDVRLAEKRLKSFLGMELNEPIILAEENPDTSLNSLLSLSALVDTALKQRPEMRSAELLTEITHKAVRIAKADYYPSLEAVSSYNWQSVSDDFTLSDNVSESWTAGLALSIPIFSGGKTKGEVGKRYAEHLQVRLATQQLRNDIRLEVEEAYDQLLQAKEALTIQKETIAQAEEGLRIANLRNETGVGTLLEVLSAQAALTNARNIEAQAIFFFRTALAKLKKATTIELNT